MPVWVLCILFIVKLKKWVQKNRKKRLNPHHSFFVIVNNGEGDEIEYRSKLEKHLTDNCKIPGVLIVVGGGKGTLKTVSLAFKDKVPIILIYVRTK
jgi:NAD kinase